MILCQKAELLKFLIGIKKEEIFVRLEVKPENLYKKET